MFVCFRTPAFSNVDLKPNLVFRYQIPCDSSSHILPERKPVWSPSVVQPRQRTVANCSDFAAGRTCGPDNRGPLRPRLTDPPVGPLGWRRCPWLLIGWSWESLEGRLQVERAARKTFVIIPMEIFAMLLPGKLAPGLPKREDDDEMRLSLVLFIFLYCCLALSMSLSL